MHRGQNGYLINCFWIFSASPVFLRPVQYHKPLLPWGIQHHHDGLSHLRDTVHQETAELWPRPEALPDRKWRLRQVRDTGEVHIRLQVLLLRALFLQRGGAAARLRRFYGNTNERESGGGEQEWQETVTVSTVPARHTRDTSMWRGRCWSTILQRWRSSKALSGISVKHTGKWYVLTGRGISRRQGGDGVNALLMQPL